MLSGLKNQVEAYLSTVLGSRAVTVQPWPVPSGLPYYLRDAFDFGQLSLLGHAVVLAVGRDEADDGRSLKTHLSRLREHVGLPVLYVTERLASYERRNLIEQGIAFLVPGNQLFLPDLGVDLREYFAAGVDRKKVSLGPSAQLLLIQALLREQWTETWTPSAGTYTVMTLSRVARELRSHGLIELRKDGHTNTWVFKDDPRTTWQRALPLLRSPVRRKLYVARDDVNPAWPIAGFSALAAQTMLNDSSRTVYATSTIPDVLQFPAGFPNALELQVWTYAPDWRASHAVDPLSLILSLRDDEDPRVQTALAELERLLPW